MSGGRITQVLASGGRKQPRQGDLVERELGTKSFHLPPLLSFSCQNTIVAKLNPKLEGRESRWHSSSRAASWAAAGWRKGKSGHGHVEGAQCNIHVNCKLKHLAVSYNHILFLSDYFFKNLFLFFGRTECGILVPQPGIKPVSPALGTWSLNQWTAREVLISDFFFKE